MNRLLFAPIFLFALLVNPAFIGGCGPIDEDFTYGEPEMLDLLNTVSERSWSHVVDAADYTIELELTQGERLEVTRAQPSLVASSWACTERSFVRGAAACFDQSLLAVEGTLTVTDAAGETVVDAAPVTGSLAVVGLHLNNANLTLSADELDLRLTSDDGATFQLAHLSW